jgi:cytochrome P450 family 144
VTAVEDRLLDEATIQDPYAFYASLRTHAPVWRVPEAPMYLVSTWDLVTEAVGRVDDLSSNLDLLLYTEDGRPAMFDMRPLGANIRTLATADPPVHGAHRKLVFPDLVAKRMAGLEPTTRTLAASLLEDSLADCHVEWSSAVANPLPVAVLAELMGFREYDLDTLVGWALDGAQLLAGTCTAAQMAHLTARAAEAGAYLAGELDAAPPEAEAGVLGTLKGGVIDGRLSYEEAVSTLIILLGAGGESTGALVGSCVRLLAERPDLQRRLRADQSAIPAFIEEVLRLESPFRGHYRVARRDLVLGDTEIPRESAVYLLWASANRDPSAFATPDEVVLHREHARGHLGFGRGIHFCVGAPLARMEARVVLEVLLDRTSEVAMDPDRAPKYVSSIFVRRHESLPLVLDGMAARSA